MKRPTTQANYTPHDLKKYALYRKKREFKNLLKIQKIKEKHPDDYEAEESYQDLYREPTIFSSQVYKIELSSGGDADGFKIEKKDGEIIGGVYYWSDWGVYEEVELTLEETDQVSEHYYFALLDLDGKIQ